MPAVVVDENEVPRIPDLSLSQRIFLAVRSQDRALAEAVMAEVREKNMAGLYDHLASHESSLLGLARLSADEVARMKEANLRTTDALDAKHDDAEKKFGESECFDALLARATHFATTGYKDKAIEAFRVAAEKAPGLGHRIDTVFAQMRIALFFLDHELMPRLLEKAKTMVDEGGDWDRRNRLKVYEGIYALTIRDFDRGSKLLLDSLATFTSTEIMSYQEFVKYAVLASMLAVPRAEIKKKVIDAPEILEVIHEIPNLEDYVNSLYTCKYAQFFTSLATVEAYLKNDRYLYLHYQWYTREMRILAYTQLLESYRSMTIPSMAAAFGVTQDFIDRDVSKFIAAGRLHCVIDKVGGIIETNRPDSKNAQYQTCIKQGDALLNRIQKLSRVINI